MKIDGMAVISLVACMATSAKAFVHSSSRPHSMIRIMTNTNTRSIASASPFSSRRFLSEGTSEEEEEGATSSAQIDPDVLENVKDPFLQTMRDRGFLFQCTNLKDLDEYMSSSDGKPTSAYLGFDATADSLHVGSLLQIMILRHLQNAASYFPYCVSR